MSKSRELLEKIVETMNTNNELRAFQSIRISDSQHYFTINSIWNSEFRLVKITPKLQDKNHKYDYLLLRFEPFFTSYTSWPSNIEYKIPLISQVTKLKFIHYAEEVVGLVFYIHRKPRSEIELYDIGIYFEMSKMPHTLKLIEPLLPKEPLNYSKPKILPNK
jgi:hypothetical protein